MIKGHNNSLFEKIKKDNHEQLVFCNDDSLGLKAIIGIHDTTLGPAIGGTRMWNYENDEAALKDVINLSKAMSYKSSLAGLNAGGGKAVIIGDINLKSEKFIAFLSFAFCASFNAFVASLIACGSALN